MNENEKWGVARKNELMALASEESPIYVYNEETLNEIFFDLLSIDLPDLLFYPVHANAHPKILTKVFEMDLGFACISTDEITCVLKDFPELSPQRILFVPNQADGKDFECAFRTGVYVVLKRFYPLKAWPNIFKNREIFIGMGMSRDEASYDACPPEVSPIRDNQSLLDGNTGLFEIENVFDLLSSLEISLKGLYIQPKIHPPALYDINAITSFLVKACGQFPTISTFILKDGIRPPLDRKRGYPDMTLIEDCLEEIRKIRPQHRLWIEPGEDMVSHAGVLLATVTETGEENGIPYIRTNADMKSLRPDSFHRARHQIVNLTRSDNEKTTVMARIMGQEEAPGTEDDLVKISLPVEENDILLFTNMGSYGAAGNPDSIREGGVSEHYLSARRICQVKI